MKLGRRKHSEMSAMFQAYPDSRVMEGSRGADLRQRTEDAAFAALPRCRCGLLLPCNSRVGLCLDSK